MNIQMASADLDETDYAAVMEVLRSGRLALGPKVQEFEQQMAEYVGVRHAIAVSSGTAGLHLIVRALGIGKGDEVLVPSFTFAASVNALLYEGAIPVFVDIEPEVFNMDLEDLKRKISPRTKAIMAVDVFGHPEDWDALMDIADRYGLRVIDDCCEAIGSEYKGRKLGQFGDAGCFAFYPNKQITTGEGGMIVTNSDDLAQLCRSMANQGRGVMGAWLEHERLGYNYRLDEMSAALGVSQLRKLEHFIELRSKVAQLYTQSIEKLDSIRPPLVKPNVRMSWFVYVALLAEGLDRGPVMRELEAMKIPSRAYFSPIHSQSYIVQLLGKSAPLPQTESVARRTIALPFHNRMTASEIDQVVWALGQAIERCWPITK